MAKKCFHCQSMNSNGVFCLFFPSNNHLGPQALLSFLCCQKPAPHIVADCTNHHICHPQHHPLHSHIQEFASTQSWVYIVQRGIQHLQIMLHWIKVCALWNMQFIFTSLMSNGVMLVCSITVQLFGMYFTSSSQLTSLLLGLNIFIAGW